MDTGQLVSTACREIAELTKDRTSVLIFTAPVEHRRHAAEKIFYYSGKECTIVTGETSPGERAENGEIMSILLDFRFYNVYYNDC